MDKKEREARSSISGAQNITDIFLKKGERIKLAVQAFCGCLGLSQLSYERYCKIIS